MLQLKLRIHTWDAEVHDPHITLVFFRSTRRLTQHYLSPPTLRMLSGRSVTADPTSIQGHDFSNFLNAHCLGNIAARTCSLVLIDQTRLGRRGGVAPTS